MLRNTFSYSQLNTFKTCPQQYKIIYLDGVRKEHASIEAFMGKIVHEVLEWLYNPENMEKSYITFDHLSRAYDDQWAKNWHDHIYIADSRKKTDFYYYRYRKQYHFLLQNNVFFLKNFAFLEYF